MKNLTLPAILLIVLTLSSFGNKSEIIKNSPKEIKKNYISTGISGEVGEVFVSKYEVSNASYQEFEAWVKNQSDPELAKIVKVMEDGWVEHKPYYKPFTKYYYSHPAFQEYPVVNISQEAAVFFCKYLSEKYSAQSDDYNYNFRLPTKQEWLQIAQSGNEKASYSWGSNHLNNSDRLKRCNYFDGQDNFLTRNPKSGELEYVDQGETNVAEFMLDGYEATAPVNSYQASKSGVFNLNGNVAEMVAESGLALGGSFYDPGYDVRNQSEKNYSKPSSLIGFRPVFEISLK